MARTIISCIAVALLACAASPKQLRFDSTPGQLSVAGAPIARGPDAIWFGETSQQTVTLRATVHFHTGTATIEPSSYRVLDDAARSLRDRRDVKHVIIEGHTDSSGGEQLNATLSQQRAEAVRGYLVEKGIDPTRLEARGYGASRPVASNATEQGRGANRRVDLDLRTAGR